MLRGAPRCLSTLQGSAESSILGLVSETYLHSMEGQIMKTLSTGTRVRVHYHLTKRIWSIFQKVPGKGWRLAEHRKAVLLSDVIPVISRSRCQAIRASWEQKGKRAREICARLEGNLEAIDNPEVLGASVQIVRFNPYRGDDFTYPDGTVYVGSVSALLPAEDTYAIVGGVSR